MNRYLNSSSLPSNWGFYDIHESLRRAVFILSNTVILGPLRSRFRPLQVKGFGGILISKNPRARIENKIGISPPTPLKPKIPPHPKTRNFVRHQFFHAERNAFFQKCTN